MTTPRRRRPPAAYVLAAATVALAGAAMSLTVACEAKIEEPVPDRPRPVETTPAVAASASNAPAAPAKRCIKETPEKAERTVKDLPKGYDPACPKDPEEHPAKMQTGTVTFTNPKGDKVTVEIAGNSHDRQRGLMYRKSMPQDRGMIFTFDEKEDHTFWMHNTCIPLDMLYIDDDGMIVGIEENTPTMSDDTFSVGCLSKYVLELNAGWTRKHGVVAGQKVKLEGI